MFVSPDLNLTYYQYTGDRGDSAMIQLIKDRDAEKLNLYAFIREKMLPLHYTVQIKDWLIIDFWILYLSWEADGGMFSSEVTSTMWWVVEQIVIFGSKLNTKSGHFKQCILFLIVYKRNWSEPSMKGHKWIILLIFRDQSVTIMSFVYQGCEYINLTLWQTQTMSKIANETHISRRWASLDLCSLNNYPHLFEEELKTWLKIFNLMSAPCKKSSDEQYRINKNWEHWRLYRHSLFIYNQVQRYKILKQMIEM